MAKNTLKIKGWAIQLDSHNVPINYKFTGKSDHVDQTTKVRIGAAVAKLKALCESGQPISRELIQELREVGSQAAINNRHNGAFITQLRLRSSRDDRRRTKTRRTIVG